MQPVDAACGRIIEIDLHRKLRHLLHEFLTLLNRTLDALPDGHVIQCVAVIAIVTKTASRSPIGGLSLVAENSDVP